MPASNNFLRLQAALLEAFRNANHDPRFPESKLAGDAGALGLTPDALNNQLYRDRGDLNESFVVEAFRVLSNSVPEIAAQLLQRWLIDSRITIRTEETIDKVITEMDVRAIVLRAGREVGNLQGAVADHVQDGNRDLFEVSDELYRVEALIRYFGNYKAKLLREQADFLESGARPRKFATRPSDPLANGQPAIPQPGNGNGGPNA